MICHYISRFVFFCLFFVFNFLWFECRMYLYVVGEYNVWQYWITFVVMFVFFLSSQQVIWGHMFCTLTVLSLVCGMMISYLNCFFLLLVFSSLIVCFFVFAFFCYLTIIEWNLFCSWVFVYVYCIPCVSLLICWNVMIWCVIYLVICFFYWEVILWMPFGSVV